MKAYLAERFPNTRTVFERYKDEARPIQVPASAVAIGGTGTVGGAFDYLVRFLIHPQPDVDLAGAGASPYGRWMRQALSELASRLGAHPLSPNGSSKEEPLTMFIGPPWPSIPDFELLARGCWALALLTEIARGVPPGRSPLAELDPHTANADDLLAIAPSAGLEQLSALRSQAEAVLLPALASRRGPWVLGPTFEGSTLMNADADMIAAGTLIEIKTVLGNKRKDGTRYASLDAPTLFQMLGYVLLDFHDEFAIHELMYFNARYGYAATWQLEGLLNTLAGRTVELPALRAEFAAFLRAGM